MAVTATVTSTKIDITSTGGVQETWADIVTAINLKTTGTVIISGQDFEIKGNRELEISSGCKVKFEEDDQIAWNEITTSGRIALDFAAGSEIEIEPGVLFDVSGSSAAQIYFYHYGKITAIGTSSKRIVFNGVSRNAIYNRVASEYEYVDFTNCRYSTGYFLYFSVYSNAAAPECSMKHIRIFNDSGTYGYGMYFSGGGDFTNWTFDDIEIDGTTYAVLAYKATAKFSNCLFKNAVGQLLLYSSGNAIGNTYQTSKDNTMYPFYPRGVLQPWLMFDNCTFQDMDLGAYTAYVYYNALVHFKDCEFIGDTYSGTQDGVYAGYSGRAIWSGTNTFTNIQSGRERVWAGDGTHLHGYDLDLTVIDENEDPVENACVSIIQQSTTPREMLTGLTDSLGNLLNMHGDFPILIGKEETSAGVYQQWSNDESSGLYHKIIVSKEGYETAVENVEFTSDKTIEIQLEIPGASETSVTRVATNRIQGREE